MNRSQVLRAVGEKRIAVVLLVHRAALGDLPACAQSLRQQAPSAPPHRLWVVENGADPLVAAAVRRHCPQARHLTLPTNEGWSAGNNAAIRAALAEGAAMVVLVNVDTVLDPAWLERLVAEAAARPDLHILQSKILLHGTDRLNSFGNRIHYLGYGFCAGHGRREQPGRKIRIDFASGAAMLVKAEVFEAVGLFREEYFIYGEDLEFCWRARLAGFNVGLVAGSVCHHRYQFRRQRELLFLRERNRLTTLLTLARRRTLLVLAPCLLTAQVCLYGYALAAGWGQGVWRLCRHFSRPSTWRRLREVRRQIQAFRVRSDAEIVRQFAGMIEFPEFGGRMLRYVINPCLQAYWWVVRGLIVW